MNVIIVKGGLGNQLFQYAFGRVQMLNGLDIIYNLLWYEKSQQKPFRPYRLDKFHIIPIKTNLIEYPSKRKQIQGWVEEETFNQEFLKKNNCIFNGYWQYYVYYEDTLSILRKEFQVKEEFYTVKFLDLRKRIINNNSVSVHVRRSDYSSHHGFGCLPFRYYFNAIKKIKGDLFIFSDDIAWCREIFKKDYFSQKITFIHLDDYLDFELMRLCKHNIIANSSFSWLAAYLNDNLKKIVICPMYWLNEKFVDKDRYPEDWIKIKC